MRYLAMRYLGALLLFVLAAPAVAGTLLITVTAEGERPVEGATVALVPADRAVSANEILDAAAHLTNERGQVEFEAPEGGVLVLVRAAGRAIGWSAIRGGEGRVTVFLPGAAAIKGQVLGPDGNAVPGARIVASAERAEDREAFLAAGEVGFVAVCDNEGRFEVPGLTAERRYRIRATGPGFAPAVARDMIPGGEVVSVRLPRGARVTGRLFRLPGGKPLAGITVRVGTVEAATGKDGSFSVSGVAPGRVRVDVDAEGFLFQGPRDLVLVDGETRGELFLKVLALGALKGRILTAATRPVSGAIIMLRYPPGTDLEERLPADRIVTIGQSGPDGKFEIPGLLPAQGVDLVVRHPDHAPTVHLGYSIIAGRRVTAIVLMRDGGTISGRIIDNEGAGMAGATVHALDRREDPGRILSDGRPLFPTHRTTKTDDSGAFTLTHVPSGRRTIVARREAMLPVVETGVEVGEGTHRKNVILLAGKGSRIAGTVADPEGRPVPQATVHLAAALGLGYSRKSGADGTFEFTGLPAGNYAIRAEADGFSASVPRPVAAPAVDIAIVLTPGMGLSGRVLLEETVEAVAPASVRVLRQSEASVLRPWEPTYVSVREVRAEPPEGRFSAGDLDPGIYRVEAWTEDGKYGFRDGIRIVAGQAVEPLVVRVAAGWAIIGRVIDGRNGMPLEGATVALRTGADRPGPHRATTDGMGRFRIDGVSAGFHSLLVVARDLSPTIVDSVELKAAADTNLEDIVLREGSKVTGSVTGPEGEARAGVRLTLQSAILGGAREERTDEQGRFTFANVSPGSYLLSASDGMTSQFVRRQERLITVRAGQDLAVSLGTGKGSVLMGQVTSGRSPVAHAQVSALLAAGELSKRRQVVTTKSDRDGNYVFTDIPPGEHLLTVTLPWSGRNPVRFGARVLPGPVTILDLFLPDSGIEGIAFDLDTGEPLPGVLLRLTRETGGAEGTFLSALTREMGEATSGKDGGFRFPALPPGEYRIDGYREGYGQTDLAVIRVVPGGFTPVRIELPPAGVLKGRVVDDRGRPVTTARVRFRDADGAVATRRPWYSVDAEGRFVISELRTGTYRVEAEAPGFARAEEREADVFPGGGVELTLRLIIEGRLEITVYGEGGVPIVGARLTIIDFWGMPVEFPKPKVGPLTPFQDPAITGEGGRLLVRNLPPGVYTITATSPGHVGPPVRVRVLDGELSRGAVVLLRTK